MLKLILLVIIPLPTLIATPTKNKTNRDRVSVLSGTIRYESQDPNAQAGSFLKCKINGQDWTATKMTPDKYPSEIVQIQAEKDKTYLWLQLNKPAAGKTDVLIETDLNNYTDEKFNMYMIKTGKTVITKMDDKWIEGTFLFSAQDNRSLKKIEVTNGSFRVPNPKSFKDT